MERHDDDETYELCHKQLKDTNASYRRHNKYSYYYISLTLFTPPYRKLNDEMSLCHVMREGVFVPGSEPLSSMAPMALV